MSNPTKFEWGSIDEPLPELPSDMPIIKDGQIVFSFRDAAYPISLDRCATYQKIVWWTMHLIEKPWITKEKIDHFIYLACTHHHLEPQGPL